MHWLSQCLREKEANGSEEEKKLEKKQERLKSVREMDGREKKHRRIRNTKVIPCLREVKKGKSRKRKRR